MKSIAVMQALLALCFRPPPRCPSAFTCRPFSVSYPLCAKKKRVMPPKKAPKEEKKTLLGRPGNNLKIGIVGLFAEHCVAACHPTGAMFRLAKRWKVVLLQHLVQDWFVSRVTRMLRRLIIQPRSWQGGQLSVCHHKP